MTDVPAFHAQRDRAESFGSVAESYDQFRPSYPDQLVEALVALHPAAVLDIGCGTGKAARQLAARGLDVLGVEIDAEMAAVARRHGIDVEVASFEQWDARDRMFDLIVAGQAWHWIDPEIGAPKIVRLLRPGGNVCFFWNYEEPDDATEAAINDVYRRLAPQLLNPERAADDDDSHADALRATGCFSSVRTEKVTRDETLPVDAWISRMSTYSNHVILGPARLTELQQAMRTALASPDGNLHLPGGTYIVWAQP